MNRTPLFRWVVILAIGMLGFSCTLATVDTETAGDSYALVYGIADYDHWNDLTYTVNDAREMADLLAARNFDVVSRFNAEVTKERMLLDMEGLKNRADPDPSDIIVLFFSGHGDGLQRVTPLSGTLTSPEIPSDLYMDQASIIPNTSAAAEPQEIFYAEELLLELAEIPGKKVLIIDICFAGGFVYDSGSDVDGLPSDYGYTGDPPLLLETWRRYFSGLADNPYADIWVIGSAGENELAWEGSTVENGYFSYNMLAALGYDHQDDTVTSETPADRNGDGLITLSELYMESFSRFNRSYNDNSSVPASNKYYSHFSGGAYDLILYRE